MFEWLSAFLFSDGGYSPHGFCIAWNLPVLYTHIGADLLIALSYFAIPAVMLVFLRHRRDSRLHAPAMLFVIFITACGVSHLMSIVTMYYPYYGLQGVIKLFTGAVSFVTAIALWRMLPDALRIPAPEDLLHAQEAMDEETQRKVAAEGGMQRSQAELALKVAELESANRELREFAYAASHDLKSPANTLSLWLTEFSRDAEHLLTGDLREEVADAQHIVERMRQLVEDILAYSRIVSRDEGAVELCDLQEIAKAAVADLGSDIEATGARVTLEPLPQIMGHAPLLSILIQNLLANAIKFRPPDRRPEVVIRGSMDSGNAILSVRDNGIGIAAEHQERIFQLFNRLHHDSRYQGTGLGLALCRRAVAVHGGTIEVKSEVGAGTEFRITLPQMEKTDAQQAA